MEDGTASNVPLNAVGAREGTAAGAWGRHVGRSSESPSITSLPHFATDGLPPVIESADGLSACANGAPACAEASSDFGVFSSEEDEVGTG